MTDASRIPEPSARPHHAPPVHHLHTAHGEQHSTAGTQHAGAEGHPEDVDPLGKRHPHPVDPSERRTSRILTISLVVALLLIPYISAISESPMLNVLLGLSPLIVTIILDIIATQHHFKPITFWITLVVVHALSLAVLWLINILLPVKMNVPSAVATSLILGVLVTALCWLSNPRQAINDAMPKRKEQAVQFKPEKLSEYVQSIEDKCKGLNFTIGRVYRNSNGGTPHMRERLRIPSEWYNDFHSIKAEDMAEQQEKAKVLIHKIRDRLKVLAMKEKEVFSHPEAANLKHIMRHKEGEDRIIDVLKANDRDPVDHYYVSAVEFCDRILEELEKLR